MNDDLLKNVFTSSSPWSHNNTNVGGTDASANVAPSNSTGSSSNPSCSCGSNGGYCGGGGKSDDKPSVAGAIFHTMMNNPFGQKMLAAIFLTIFVYVLYLVIALPTMFGGTADNQAEFMYAAESVSARERPKPSFMQKLFCRGGKTSSFCTSQD